MKTLRPPVWHSDFTKKYWAKNKSSKVKKTGVGERIDKAQALFEKIKWEQYDASLAKQRIGYGAVIDKLEAAQIAPIQKLASEIIACANDAARDKNADADMIKLCKLTASRADVVKQMLARFLDEARENAAEFDRNSQNYAKSRIDFIKSFTVTLKDLEAEARALVAQAQKAGKLVLITRQQSAAGNMEAALKAASAAQIEATGVQKAAKDLSSRRAGYQALMGAQRNLTPGSYNLTTQDVQIHDNLAKMIYALFKRFDEIYHDIDEAATVAEKHGSDAAVFADRTADDTTKWRKKLTSDTASLRKSLEQLQLTTTSQWGSQISKKGAVFDETIAMIAKDKNMLGGAIKRCEQAESGMPKTLQFAQQTNKTITENFLRYKSELPKELIATFFENIANMTDIAKEAGAILTQFEKDYAISMKKLEVLKKAIAKLQK